MCDLVPCPEIEPGPPALECSLSHWTTREVLELSILTQVATPGLIIYSLCLVV